MTFEDFSREWNSGAESVEARTSGSTGVPKHIRLDRRFMEASARATNRFFRIDSSSWLHSCVAADFIGGKMMYVRASLAGCRFSSEIPSNRPLRGSLSANLTLVALVPSQMRDVLDRVEGADPSLPPLPEVGTYLIGGSAIPSDMRRRIGESGLRCFESYGMTETSSHIAVRQITGSPDAGWFGLIRDDVTLTVDDRGCLTIDFPDFGERIVTNDIAELHDSRHFRIRGRADDVIVTGGRKVHPADVESRLSAQVTGDFAISSVPHPLWGEAVVAVATERCTLAGIARVAAGVLQPWERPKSLLLVESLPLTANGKLSRRGLAKKLREFCYLEIKL